MEAARFDLRGIQNFSVYPVNTKWYTQASTSKCFKASDENRIGATIDINQ